MNKTFNFYFFSFNFLITFLLIEGLYHHFYYKISSIFSFIPFKNQSGHNTLIWDENGVVENLQVILLFFSIVIFFIFLKKNIYQKKFTPFYYLYFLALCYYFFEEISWGQHLIGWQTPSFFSDINQQNETNFHNTSNLFNELPRNLLFIWCGLSFILAKITYLKYFNFLILPNFNLKKISILILFFYLPNFLVDRLNLYPGHPALNPIDIKINTILDIVTFNFIRLSELHELLFNYYILSHAYYLLKKMEHQRYTNTK